MYTAIFNVQAILMYVMFQHHFLVMFDVQHAFQLGRFCPSCRGAISEHFRSATYALQVSLRARGCEHGVRAQLHPEEQWVDGWVCIECCAHETPSVTSLARRPRSLKLHRRTPEMTIFRQLFAITSLNISS